MDDERVAGVLLGTKRNLETPNNLKGNYAEKP